MKIQVCLNRLIELHPFSVQILTCIGKMVSFWTN